MTVSHQSTPFAGFGSRALTVLREAVALERLRPKVARNRAELGFLPAALEVLETPPHPAARVLAWTLTALLLVAIIWAWLRLALPM